MENIIMYLSIFLAQAIQLAIKTYRTILTARKEKVINTLLCIVQNLCNIYATAFVIIGITEDPLRAIFFVLGCSFGCYVGMVLDKKFAIGKDMLTVIVDCDKGSGIAKEIREKGYAVTTLDGKSKEKDKMILMIGTNRKKENELIKIILSKDKNALLIDESINSIGGYF